MTVIGRALAPRAGSPAGTVRVRDERGEAYAAPARGWDHERAPGEDPGR